MLKWTPMYVLVCICIYACELVTQSCPTFCDPHLLHWGSVGKESTCNTGGAGDTGSIPGSGRSPGGGHGNTLQRSCLENPMDRRAWQATVHWAVKSWTLYIYIYIYIYIYSEGKEGKAWNSYIAVTRTRWLYIFSLPKPKKYNNKNCLIPQTFEKYLVSRFPRSDLALWKYMLVGT